MSRRHVDAFHRLLPHGTDADRAAAVAWYPAAMELAEQVAIAGGYSLPIAAGVIAALSPRCSWELNQRIALDYAAGRPVKALGNSIRAAGRVVANGLADLRGPKVRSFASAILGDWRCVVIDSHMLHAAGETVDKPTKTLRLNVTDAVYRVSREVGLSPRDTQAYLWIIQKRVAGRTGRTGRTGQPFVEGDF